MAVQENQRIRLSKQLLKDALFTLLKKQNIHKVSIREICNMAGINRSTFYKYYGSQYDLFSDITDDLFEVVKEALKEHIEKPDIFEYRLKKVLMFIKYNREKMLILLDNSTDQEFVNKLMDLPEVDDFLKIHCENINSEKQYRYISTFIVHGAFQVILLWTKTGAIEPIEEIYEIIWTNVSHLFNIQ